MKSVFKKYYESPIGLIEITGESNSVSSLYFIDQDIMPRDDSNLYLDKCAAQLEEYFNGGRKDFNLILNPEGTIFQKKVWDELQKISYGKIISYMDLTKKLGDIKAIRAVANANGQNKISIIIPCHRVIGSNGSLTGYGGGLWRKKWLLEHEQKYSNSEKQLSLTL